EVTANPVLTVSFVGFCDLRGGTFLFPITRLLLRPIARVFVEERQRLERPHPVDEQDAVEMIGLVLNDALTELARLDLDALAVAVVRAHLDLARPRHEAADLGNAQAALPVL